MLPAHELPLTPNTLTSEFTDDQPICSHPLGDVLDAALLDSNLGLRDRRRIAAVDLDLLTEEVSTAVCHGLRPTPMEILRLADWLTHGPTTNQPVVDYLPRDPQPEAATWALDRMVRQ